MENPFKKTVESVRDGFDQGVTLDVQFRRNQLKSLKRMFVECRSEILEALRQDLRKSDYEGKLGDVKTVTAEIDTMLRNMRDWGADEWLPFNLLVPFDKAYIRKEPYGVVLIIGTWNYPFQSCCQPLAGAIAAGNCAILKPSEVTPACAKVMGELIPKFLDSKCYQVINGGVDTARRLLENKFDHIFCTGSPSVGRSVLQAAAPHLTPVTLELGGKSPCFIDKSTDFKRAAKRLLWGKMINDGQICIGPDYLICPKEAEEELLKVAKSVLKEWYGENSQSSPDIIRIVNKKHFNRLKKLLETTEGKVVLGGKMDEDDLWIEPTIVANVDPIKDSLMQEEIFGPILPIIRADSVDDAIKIIRTRSKPLSMYVFSNDSEVTRKLIGATSSGSICVNDVIWQGTWIGLPFGGVGDSGMGSFHGKCSFDNFSHRRACLERPISLLSEKLGEARYPPFSPQKYAFFARVIQNFERCNVSVGGKFSHLLAAIAGALIAFTLSILISALM